MNRNNICSALVALLMHVFVTAQADTIVLKNGRRLQGAITSSTTNEYIIKTEVGALRVIRADVASLESIGTTSEEVDGDLAYSKKQYAAALDFYKAAAARATDAAARQRLAQKVGALAQYQVSTMNSAAARELQQVQQLITAREYNRAIQSLEALIPTMTDDQATSAAKRLLAEAHYHKALLARDSVNEIQMEKELKAAISAFEPYFPAHLIYGEHKLKSSVTQNEGIDYIQRGLNHAGNMIAEEDKIRYHYILGKKHFDVGNYEQAASHFAESLSAKDKYPAYADAMERAVQAYIKMGEKNVVSDFQKTIDSLNEALRLTPDNKDALFLLGRIYKDTGQSDKAIQVLTRVVQIDPTYKQAHHVLAQAYLDKRDFDTAVKNLDRELQNDPTNYDALADRAEARIVLAEYDKASLDLKAAQQIEPDRWLAFLLNAQLSYAQERYEEAQQHLMKVLQIQPDAIEAHIQMGKVLMAQKMFDDAKKWFTNVVDYLDKSQRLSFRYKTLMAEAQTDLGSIDLLQDSPRQAETRFRQALDFMPNFAPAFNRIGDVKRRLGDEATDKDIKVESFKQAEGYYKKAIEVDPRNPNFYLSLGILYHKNIKDTQRARENYERYLALGGRDLVNVKKWIEEVSGIVAADDSTTGTAVDGATTGTAISDGQSTGTTITPANTGETSTTLPGNGTTPATAPAGI